MFVKIPTATRKESQIFVLAVDLWSSTYFIFLFMYKLLKFAPPPPAFLGSGWVDPSLASGAKSSIVLGSLKFSDNAVFSIYSDVQRTGHSKLGTKAGLQRAINQFAQEKKAETAKNDTGKYFQYELLLNLSW